MEWLTAATSSSWCFRDSTMPGPLEKAQEIRSLMKATVYLGAVTTGVELKASFGVSTYPRGCLGH